MVSRVKVTLSVVTMMPSWLRFHSQDIVVPFAATLRTPCPNDASLQDHNAVSRLKPAMQGAPMQTAQMFQHHQHIASKGPFGSQSAICVDKAWHLHSTCTLWRAEKRSPVRRPGRLPIVAILICTTGRGFGIPSTGGDRQQQREAARAAPGAQQPAGTSPVGSAVL